MKPTHYIAILTCLLASPLLSSTSWGQTGTRSVSIPETASIEGTVVDAATGRPVPGATILAKNQAGRINAQQRVGFDGAYRLGLDDSKQAYLIVANANGYEPYEERVAFTTSNVTQLFKKAIRLQRIGANPPIHQNATIVQPPTTPNAPSSATPTALTEVTVVGVLDKPSPSGADQPKAGPRVTPPKTLDAKVIYTPPLLVAATGKTTQLRAVQFVQSKAELLPDAQPALEQLAAFLKNNPTAEIELAGHTDNQGDFDENVRLSKQRVEVVKAYLVTNGIASGRIVTRGYGPTRPIGSNNAETTRQLNRRVEMTVLKQ